MKGKSMTESTELFDQDNTEVALSVKDIILLKTVVEIASTRGAFKANEMSEVGQLYDRVNAWCESVAQSSAENANENELNEEKTDA